MSTEADAKPVVRDAGLAMSLDELGCIDLLRDFSRVVVPVTVQSEIERPLPAALRRSGFSWGHAPPSGPRSPELLALARL